MALTELSNTNVACHHDTVCQTWQVTVLPQGRMPYILLGVALPLARKRLISILHILPIPILSVVGLKGAAGQ